MRERREPPLPGHAILNRAVLSNITLRSATMQQPSDRMDDESKKILLDVKKGKARKFVMIKDGVEIDKLYIFRKGPFDRFVRMAKQQGVRGEPFWGIVRGDGLDIRFELSRSDGFTGPPGTQIRLKEFLKETTGLKLEPDYVIVDAPTPIEEDGPEVATGEDADRDEAVPEEDPGEKFVRLLKLVLPHVKRALAVATSVSDELQTRVREAQDLGRRRDFEQGLATLRIVGQLAKQALAEAETAPAAGREEPVADPVASRIQEAETKRRHQWEERVAQIEPRYSEAVRAATDDTGKMRLVMDYAQTQAARKQFVKALVGLDRLERMLDGST